MPTKRSLGALPLLYPEPTLLIATYGENCKPNVMTAAWSGICSSKPVSLAVSLQPVRWTLKAIQLRKAFTVNIPSASQVAEMDFVGIVSGKQHDKFTAAGLTAVKDEMTISKWMWSGLTPASRFVFSDYYYSTYATINLFVQETMSYFYPED